MDAKDPLDSGDHTDGCETSVDDGGIREDQATSTGLAQSSEVLQAENTDPEPETPKLHDPPTTANLPRPPGSVPNDHRTGEFLLNRSSYSSTSATSMPWTSGDLSGSSHHSLLQEYNDGSLLQRGHGSQSTLDAVLDAARDSSPVHDFKTGPTSMPSAVEEDHRRGSRRDSASAPQSPERRPSIWREFSTQTVIGPLPNPEPVRPTSVPNFQTQRGEYGLRDGSDEPYHPSPSPHQPHRLRTRSSHPSQNSSYVSSTVKARDFSSTASGSKTVGNTPAQSPGLYTPTSSQTGLAEDESEESHHNTPLLHPAHHLQAPKETYKLLKDFDPISGRKLVNNYKILKRLGSGTHATVKLGRDTNTGDLVAVKIVRRLSKKLGLGKLGDPNEMIKKEVAVLKKARHPHIVSLLEVIDDDDIKKVYLVLEYVELGEIVWRKEADRNVAIFEMNRVKRERLGQTDEDIENAEIQNFNAAALLRRSTTAQTRKDDDQHPHRRKIYWFEKEQDGHSENSAQPLSNSTQMKDSDAVEVENRQETVYTVPERSLYYEASFGSNPTLLKGSTLVQPDPLRLPNANLKETISHDAVTNVNVDTRSASPAKVDKSMTAWAQHLPDIALKSTFEQMTTNKPQWTPEEEEFMYVPCLTINQALDAFRDTVLGLEYLHYQGIIHRDIKPANLLWTSDRRVKISDFGVSYLGKPIREDDNTEDFPDTEVPDVDEALELAKTVGTPAFYAPELCDPVLFDPGKHPERPQITGQIDVWALGVTLYGMIFGRLPFFDVNEFAMYEKIARQDVFISRVRLKAVLDEAKAPTMGSKRPDDLLEYEEVDDELRDLLQKLLEKAPSKRISIQEVKRHPWVQRGITDKSAWVDETDPDLQSKGKKIEVSQAEVQEAVIGLTIVEHIKHGIRKFRSVVGRGRDQRKRGHSNSKDLESQASTSPSPKASEYSLERRRTSLRGDEQITSATLRASREGIEHPLSQTIAASPKTNIGGSYFEGSETHVVPLERTLSNAESTKTIKATIPAVLQDCSPTPIESLSPSLTDGHLSSGLGGIFSGAGRRLVNTIRGRDRGRGRDSASQSSRSSSIDTNTAGVEDSHGAPSLAISSVVVAGRVDLPPSLRNDHSAADSSAEPASSTSHPRSTRDSPLPISPYDDNLKYRRISRDYSDSTSRRRRTVSSVPNLAHVIPASDKSESTTQDHQVSPADDAPAFGISSSSEQIASSISDSTSYPSIPSVVSGASSLCAHADEFAQIQGNTIDTRPVHDFVDQPDPQNVDAKINADDDEAGYNGEGEMDSESDDEGIEIGGSRSR